MSAHEPLAYATPTAARPQWLPIKIGAAVAGAVMVVGNLVRVLRAPAQLGDFGAYYRAGQSVVAGRSPYSLDPKYGVQGAYMYCPASAHLICRPLAHLSYVWAMRAFLAVNWVATVAVVALSLRLVGTPPRSGGLADGVGFRVGLIACAATGMYLWSDLHNGQVGTLLLLACLAWVTLTLAGRPVLGGAALSLAVGLKLYPMLLVPYLLLRRRWWPGLIGLAGGLAAQFVAPALFVRPGRLLSLHAEWLRFCLNTQSVEQTIRAGNQSLLGVLARTPAVSDGVHLFAPARLDQLQHGYPVVVLLVTAALYAWVVVRRVGPAVAVSVLLVWMTVASPRAWTFNFAAELPATVLLAVAIVRRQWGWPLAVVALAGLVYAVAFDTNRLPPPRGWTAGTQFLYDKHFAAAVVLAVAVAVVCRADRQVPVSTPGPPA